MSFIIAVILFLPAYVSQIILIILLCSFCFRIIKVSLWTIEYFQQTSVKQYKNDENSCTIPAKMRFHQSHCTVPCSLLLFIDVQHNRWKWKFVMCCVTLRKNKHKRTWSKYCRYIKRKCVFVRIWLEWKLTDSSRVWLLSNYVQFSP